MRWLFFILLFNLPSLLPAQSWYLEPAPLPCITNKLYFCSPDTGFIFGLYDQQYRSTDAGHSWTFFPLPQSASITQVHFPDAQHGYIAGSLEENGEGIVWRTSDSGESWEDISPNGSVSIQTLQFANAQRGICIDAAGLLFLTLNGGTSWELQDTVEGISNQAIWLKDSICLMSGRVPSANLRPRLSKSVDGGRSWNYYNLPLNNAETIRLVKISPTKVGILFTPRYTGSSNRWLYSTDKGANWAIEDLAIQAASDIAFSDSSSAWLCSRAGNIYQGEENGTSFQTSYSSTLEWRSLQMLSPYRGYALGGFDRLLRWEAPKVSGSSNTFTLWPNPASPGQEVEVQLPEGAVQLFVFNTIGQQVEQRAIQGQQRCTLQLGQGFYQIVAYGPDWEEARSLIIQ